MPTNGTSYTDPSGVKYFYNTAKKQWYSVGQSPDGSGGWTTGPVWHVGDPQGYSGNSRRGGAKRPPVNNSQPNDPEVERSPGGHVVLMRAAPRGARNAGQLGAYGATRGGNAILSTQDIGDKFQNENGVNYSYHTMFALSMSFMIVMVAHMTVKNAGNTKDTTSVVTQTLDGSSAQASLWGWGVIFIALLSLSGFKATQSISAAFSWLIFVTVMLTNGTTLFTAVTNRVSAATGGGGASGTSTRDKGK